MVLARADKLDLYLTSMKHFSKVFQFLLQPQFHFYYFVVAMLVPNVALCITENMSAWACLSNLILPAAVYAYLFTQSRKPGLIIWVLFPFVFLAAFQLVLLYLFGNSIIAVDMFLNLVTTNANEAMELLDNLVPAVAGVFILYLPALILGGIAIKKGEQLSVEFARKARRLSGIGMGVGAAWIGLTYMVDPYYAVRTDLFPANVCYNCYLAVDRTILTSNYGETSKGFSFDAKSVHDADQREIYVFVIGETSRANNWGLYGYERNTTPLLQQQEGLVAFSDVLTQSNTTHKSVPMLMSLACAEDYDQIYATKGLITAFKDAGFYTAYLSNQDYNNSFIDIFGKEADEEVFLKYTDLPAAEKKDTKLAELVADLIKQGHQKLLVVLHTYGSHFNYYERYPQEMAQFKPDRITNVTPENRQVLVNAFDNTILQTDFFLNGLIEQLKEVDATTALLYTSDHGEDIYDDDRHLFLHASPVPSYYQLHVPFVVWTSESYRTAYPEVAAHLMANKEKKVSSNATVIHTLFGIGGIETPYRKDEWAVCSEKYTEKTRYFLNDHNLPETYDRIGMKEEDFEQFGKHGIK